MSLPEVTTRTPAEYVEAVNGVANEIIGVIRSASSDELAKKTGAEAWPVIVVAHHACGVQEFFAGVFNAYLAGESIPTFSAEDVDHNNAKHAREFANVSREETLECLEQSSADLAAAIRRFSPDQLDSLIGDMAGFQMTAAQILEFAVIGHFQEHLASIQETIGNA